MGFTGGFVRSLPPPQPTPYTMPRLPTTRHRFALPNTTLST